MKTTVTRSTAALVILLALVSSGRGGPIPPGPTGNFVNNSSAAQNAVFNISSGTVRGKLTAGELSMSSMTAAHVTATTAFHGPATGLTNIPLAGLTAGILPSNVVASSVANSGVVAGLYGGPDNYVQIRVGLDGRVTSAVQGNISSGYVRLNSTQTFTGTNTFGLPIVGSVTGNAAATLARAEAIAVSTGVNTVAIAALKVSTGVLTVNLANEAIARTAGDSAIGIATGTLRTDLSAETLARGLADAAIGVATGTLRTDLTAEALARSQADAAIGVTTGTLQTDLNSEISRATNRENAIAVSTGVIQTSLSAVILSTGVIQASLNSVILSTGIINADLQAYKTTVQASTASIYSALNSTAAALTAEISRATLRENAIAISTGALEASKVNRAGDTMTGQLTVLSSVTTSGDIQAGGKVGVNGVVPFYALDINGALRATSQAIVLGSATVSGQAAAASLVVNSAGSNPTTIYSTTSVAPLSLVLPPDAGANGYILTTNGAGKTTWQPASSASGLTFMMNGASPDVPNYLSMISIDVYTPATRSTSTVASPVGLNTYISSAVTNVGYPNLTFIPAGIWHDHVHAQATNANRIKLTMEVYLRTAAGVETDFCNTVESDYISTSETPYDFYCVGISTAIAADTRVVRKFKATTISGATGVSIYANGIGTNATDARLEMPAVSVNANNFVPYTGATKSVNLGAYGITASSFTGPLTGHASLDVQKTGDIMSGPLSVSSLSVVGAVGVGGAISADTGNFNVINSSVGIGQMPVAQASIFSYYPSTQIGVNPMLWLNPFYINLSNSQASIPQIGFGFKSPGGYPFAVIGFQEKTANGNDFSGDMIFAVKSPGQTVGPAEERMRIDWNGAVTIPGSSFSVGGSTLVVAGGKVGVGVASPIRDLDVFGTSIIRVTGPGYTSGGEDLQLSGNDQSNTRLRITNTTTGRDWAIVQGVNATNNDGVSFYNGTTNTTPFKIVEDGKVGIGAGSTIDPAAALTISGNASLTGNIISSGTGVNYLEGYTGVGTHVTDTTLKLKVANSIGIIGDIGVNPFLTIADSDDIIGSENYAVGEYQNKLFIGNGSDWGASAAIATFVRGTGNVGIGTTAPTSKLHVVGDVTVTSSITAIGNIQAAGAIIGGNTGLHTYTETKSSAAVSTTYDVSWSSGSVYWLSLNDNTTLTFSGATDGMTLTFFVKQNVGSKALTWPALSWPGGVAPTLTTTAGKTDIITVTYVGGVYYGFTRGLNY